MGVSRIKFAIHKLVSENYIICLWIDQYQVWGKKYRRKPESQKTGEPDFPNLKKLWFSGIPAFRLSDYTSRLWGEIFGDNESYDWKDKIIIYP